MVTLTLCVLECLFVNPVNAFNCLDIGKQELFLLFTFLLFVLSLTIYICVSSLTKDDEIVLLL